MQSMADVKVIFKGEEMSFSQFVTSHWQEFLGVRVIQLEGELLPPGEWPLQPTEEDASSQSRESIRFRDYGRLVFLESLGILARTLDFGGGRYTGYVVNGLNGLIALVDSPDYGDALYVFNADTPNWEQTAQLTKLDILTGSYPEFLCRIYHVDGWRDKVLSLVRRDPPPKREAGFSSGLVRRRNGVTYRVR